MTAVRPADYVDDIVFVVRGPHKGRIGYCDDHEGRKLFVTFGDCLTTGMRNYAVNTADVREPNMHHLVTRAEDLRTLLFRHNFGVSLVNNETDILYELDLVTNVIWARDSVARYSKTPEGKKIYLAHSSLDKGYVRRIHADLVQLGHNPWLDEIDIQVGESIVQKLLEAISSCDFLVLVMSQNAINSNWVKAEWQTKYWDEINSGRTKILVAMIEDVELPDFLRIKKYADFRESYEQGLAGLLQGIGHPVPKTEQSQR